MTLIILAIWEGLFAVAMAWGAGYGAARDDWSSAVLMLCLSAIMALLAIKNVEAYREMRRKDGS